MISRSGLAALLGAAALLVACNGEPDRVPYDPSTASGEHCAKVVQQELARLGVPADSIERIGYTPRERLSFGFEPRTIGYDAWVRPKGVAGYLIIEMFINCNVGQVYTRGDYNLPGVPKA
jgi:hypothetical protein